MDVVAIVVVLEETVVVAVEELCIVVDVVSKIVVLPVLVFVELLRRLLPSLRMVFLFVPPSQFIQMMTLYHGLFGTGYNHFVSVLESRVLHLVPFERFAVVVSCWGKKSECF